ncbi:hypothetical protein F5Y16DRAFT_360008 [Xylariaceae sp. FL0255]|nr:hypothetical protein F5Y16DRAFT_360008 [Xylariaceae sp. FL0255]
MENSATREMIAALRTSQPRLGLKKLTAQVNERLPEEQHIPKKRVKEIGEAITADPLSPGFTTSSPVSISKGRDDEYQRVVVKNAFENFRDSERDYFLSLTQEQLNILNPNTPSWVPAAHMRHHIEILLTLSGIKPCTLISYGGEESHAIFNALVIKCLGPVFETYDLASYGFKLKYLATDVHTNVQGHPGFGGGWVFADTRSDKWLLVKSIFFDASPEQIHDDTSIGNALGYPVRSGMNTVTFKDRTEVALLATATGQEVCCVDGLEFFCVDTEEPGGEMVTQLKVIQFFRECMEAAKAFGTDLAIDTTHHPILDAIINTVRRR